MLLLCRQVKLNRQESKQQHAEKAAEDAAPNNVMSFVAKERSCSLKPGLEHFSRTCSGQLPQKHRVEYIDLRIYRSAYVQGLFMQADLADLPVRIWPCSSSWGSVLRSCRFNS